MSNPYAPPKAELIEKEKPIDGAEHSFKLAGRGERFVAAMIDGILGTILAIPFWVFSGLWVSMMEGLEIPLLWTIMALAYGMITTILLHGYLIYKYGQTIGKRMLKIRIANLNGGLPGFNNVIFHRVLPISIVALIPFVGPFLTVVDVLFIFRGDRRCIHDFIARTQVLVHEPPPMELS